MEICWKKWRERDRLHLHFEEGAEMSAMETSVFKKDTLKPGAK